jgi:hypothetical protein
MAADQIDQAVSCPTVLPLDNNLACGMFKRKTLCSVKACVHKSDAVLGLQHKWGWFESPKNGHT